MLRRFRATFLLVAACVAVGIAPAAAQQSISRPPDKPQREDPRADQFRLADAYLRAGQTERGIALLEDLHADDPFSLPVFSSLREAYIGEKRYDDALALIEDRMERTGASPNLIAEAGRIHVLRGDLDAANEAWERALEVAPNSRSTYRVIYATQVQARLYEAARDLLLQGRDHLGDDELFQVELAELYGRLADHERALEEFAALLRVDPNRLSFVQSRLGRLLDQGGAPAAFRETLDRLIREEPLVLPYRRLAAWLYAESGDFAAALDATRALDRLGDEGGQSLYGFADAALNAGAFDEALDAYEIILDRHAGGPIAPLALLNTAFLYERRAEQNGERAFDGAGNRIAAADYDRALSRYNVFLRTHPTHPNYPAALRRLAGLQKDVFRDYGQAEALLREIVERFPNGRVSAEASLDLGEVALLRDDLGTARAAFSGVEERERIGEIAERARLELARLDFYEGNFETAKTRAQAMNRNTATDVANDAIALQLLVSENTGPDSTNAPLRTFARARLLQRQHRPGPALAAVDSLLAAHPQHGLADEATFFRATVLRALGRPEDALAALGAFPDQFPESHLADRSLFTVGETWERDLGDPTSAIAAYADLLARYPGSLLAPEARARIRRLRGDGV